MNSPFIILSLSVILALAGCLNGSPNSGVDTDDSVNNPAIAYDDGRLFALTGCSGAELTQEWVGPHGPNGPRTPPDSWVDRFSEYDFKWSLEVLKCDRLGWGIVEREAISVGLEFHNAYLVPEACRADLDESIYLRYLHGLYVDDSDIVAYANSWGVPATMSGFSWDEGILDSMVLQLSPAGADMSTIEVHRSGAFDGDAADINVAFFWFQDEQVHRLTLHRQTRTTLGDVAVMDMAPPTIMGDLPGPTAAAANWLTNLSWTGDLVTFSDAECTHRVEP